MADPAPVGDVAAAVFDTLRGDRAGLKTIVADARQRAGARGLDALRHRARDSKAMDSVPAPVAQPVPRPGPDREVDIRLGNGRRLRARISPALARRTDLSAVARASAENNRRAFDALRRQRRAIERLRQSQDELAKKLIALQQQSDRALVGLLQGLSGLDRPGARTSVARQLRRQQLRQTQETRLLAVRAQIQSATSVVNSVQATAFGEKGSLFAPNNLRLAANQLFWTFLDPVLQRIGLVNATSATILAALAPVGSLISGQIMLGDRQHVRIISGATTLDSSGFASESLRGRIAEGFWPEFRRRTDVLVTAKIVDPPAFGAVPVLAIVNQGNLELRIPVGGTFGLSTGVRRLPGPVRVAWTVDTGADVG